MNQAHNKRSQLMSKSYAGFALSALGLVYCGRFGFRGAVRRHTSLLL